MVNYGAAFRLPFSNWGRVGMLFLLLLAVSLVGEIFSLINKLDSSNVAVSEAMRFALASLLLLPIIIFFSLITSGYRLRIMKSASMGRNELPSFEKFFQLFVQGIKYFLAILIYSSPFVIATAIGIVLVLGGIVSHSAGLTAGLAVVGVAILIPVFLVLLVFGVYVTPILAVHFAHEDRFSAFFELRKVLKYAFTTAYFVPWLAAFGYSIALSVPYFAVLLLMSLISLVMPIATLFMVPVSAIYSTLSVTTLSSLYGQAYSDVRASEKGKSAVGKLHVARKK